MANNYFPNEYFMECFKTKNNNDIEKFPERETIPLRKVAATYLGKKSFSETRSKGLLCSV